MDVGPVAVPASKIRTTDQVIVITDASLTMVKGDHFGEAKALTRGLVRAMPESSAPARNPGSYEASVVSFGGRDREGAPLDSFDRGTLGASARRRWSVGVAVLACGVRAPQHVRWQALHAAERALRRLSEASVTSVTGRLLVLPPPRGRARCVPAAPPSRRADATASGQLGGALAGSGYRNASLAAAAVPLPSGRRLQLRGVGGKRPEASRSAS